MHRTVVAALVVALALGSTGCGGSDAPSKAEFAKRGNAACTSARTRIEQTRAKGMAAFVDKVIAYQEAKLKGIEALTPPTELQSAFTQYKAMLTQRRDLIDRVGETVKHRGRISKQEERTLVQLQTREDKLATTLGLSRCSEGTASTRH